MPTATSTSQLFFSNIGPLTTTFTEPSACASTTPPLYLAASADTGNLHAVFWKQTCDLPALGSCYPSGSAIDAASASADGFLPTFHYFSPASACPHAYTTVGAASKDKDGNITSSGFFVPPVVTTPLASYTGRLPIPNPAPNIMMQILDPEETVVVCCPENYTPGVNGNCYSRVPETLWPEPTACRGEIREEGPSTITATFSYNNTMITGNVLSWPTPTSTSTLSQTGTTSRAIISLPPFSEASYYPVASKAAVTLVHKGGQADANATGTESGTGGSASTTAPTAAAMGSGLTRSGLVAAWAFAAFAGVALAVPF